MSLSVAAAFDDQTPGQEMEDPNHNNPNMLELLWVESADLPSEVLDAHAISGVCVGTAHFHFELLVKEQHKVDASVVPVHVHQEGVLHHQPAPRPAEAEAMMTNAVQALDPVAP